MFRLPNLNQVFLRLLCNVYPSFQITFIHTHYLEPVSNPTPLMELSRVRIQHGHATIVRPRDLGENQIRKVHLFDLYPLDVFRAQRELVRAHVKLFLSDYGGRKDHLP